jgi:peptidoglycan/LPS O-acetylase OafA/YrhL
MTEVGYRVSKERLGGLDALRGAAAMLVLIFHYEALLTFVPPKGWPRADHLWSQYGLMGVELFFVISGFVILMTLESSRSTTQFAINRVARLYPAYWLSVFVCAAYLLYMKETSLKLAAINLAMLQAFYTPYNLVEPYWSLAYELWFYAIMATIFALGLLHRINVIAFAWILLAVGLRALGSHPHNLVFEVLSFLQFGHLFIAGMMIYMLATNQGSLLSVINLLICIAYSLFGRHDWSSIPYYGYFFANAVFISMVYLAATNRLPRPPSFLVSIGVQSYSLYLLHLPIGMMLTRGAAKLGLSPWIAVAAAVPVSLSAAWASRRFVEVPGQRFFRSFGSRFLRADMPARQERTERQERRSSDIAIRE